MNSNEYGVVFPCAGDDLVGVLTIPARPAPRGVLIVVGGPQYRTGSHRQFTLLARHLARAGIASLRFDYRGMGDSSGEVRSFEHTEDDIRTAIDRFVERVPAVREVIIWGLCGAASAALFYAHRDSRIGGLVLVNPWVRTEEGIARARLRHYYSPRLLHAGFWRKVWHRELDVVRSASDLVKSLMQALRRHGPSDALAKPLSERMEDGLRKFSGRVLLILSGNDLTAQEFKDVVARSRGWQTLLSGARVTRRELPEANHTFYRRQWRDQVEGWTADWLMQ